MQSPIHEQSFPLLTKDSSMLWGRFQVASSIYCSHPVVPGTIGVSQIHEARAFFWVDAIQVLNNGFNVDYDIWFFIGQILWCNPLVSIHSCRQVPKQEALGQRTRTWCGDLVRTSGATQPSGRCVVKGELIAQTETVSLLMNMLRFYAFFLDFLFCYIYIYTSFGKSIW